MWIVSPSEAKAREPNDLYLRLNLMKLQKSFGNINVGVFLEFYVFQNDAQANYPHPRVQVKG